MSPDHIEHKQTIEYPLKWLDFNQAGWHVASVKMMTGDYWSTTQSTIM